MYNEGGGGGEGEFPKEQEFFSQKNILKICDKYRADDAADNT